MIKDQWKSFSSGAHHAWPREAERAFYAGAASMMDLLLATDESNEDVTIEALITELKLFVAELGMAEAETATKH